MQINTRDFGRIEISEDEIINFPNGVYAFEDSHRFVLISPCGENKYPMWLQCVDNENLCFIVFDPRDFSADYSVTAENDVSEQLEITDETVIDYLVIAVVPEDYYLTTVNMKSPVIINSGCRKAAQIIAPENYPIKFPVFKKEEN